MKDLLERVNADVPLRSLAAAISANLAKAKLEPEMQLRASEIRQEIASYIVGVVQTENDVLLRPLTHSGTSDMLKYEMHSPDSTAAFVGLRGTTTAPFLNSNYADERFPHLHERSDDFYLGPVVDLSDGRGRVTTGQLENDVASYQQGVGLADILQFLKVAQSSPVRRTSYDTSKAYSHAIRTRTALLTFARSEPGSGIGERTVDQSCIRSRFARFQTSHYGKERMPCLKPVLTGQDHPTLQTEMVPETSPRSRKRPLSTSNMVPARAAPPTPSSTQSFSSQLPANGAGSRRLSTASSTVCFSYEQSPEIDGSSHHWSELAQPARPIAMHLALPRIELNETPMSSAITSYLDLARSMLSQGTRIEEVFGPEPPMVDLLFRPRKPSDSHSACHFAAELCKRIKGMEVASRLGITVMFVHLLRVGGLDGDCFFSRQLC